MPDLSIIIVTWKSLEYLRACISSIYRETHDISYEIIVIDNASGDNSEKLIRHMFPAVLFIQSQTNLGFARANNLGYARSAGDVLVFLNPDTEIQDNVFTRMAASLQRDPSAAAVGPCLLNTDGSLQMSCVQTYPTIWNQLLDSEALRRMFPRWRMWGMDALLSTTSQPTGVDAISGACFMVKRTAFERVGMFTETFFMYVEDLDLSYKITKAGNRILYLPDCHVIHHGGRSSASQGLCFATLRQKESLAQFFRMTRGRFYCNAFKAALTVFAVIRMVLVILSMPLGQVAFRGTDRRRIFQKWLANFRWAIGLKSSERGTDDNLRSVAPSAIQQ